MKYSTFQKSRPVCLRTTSTLKIKEEESGWPKHVKHYYAREEIQLEPEKIQNNPGLRTLAKMMLNSLRVKCKSLTKPRSNNNKFHESDKYDIPYVSVLTEKRVEMHYKHHEEDDLTSPNLNIFVACFTTCWTQLHLYEALDLLQDRVLYFDTDSVIFRSLPGQTKPELGNYLGDFKNELAEEQRMITLWNLPRVDRKTMATGQRRASKSVKLVFP